MENRIVNPFKKFLKNIILGLCLVLTLFCAVPFMDGLKPAEVDAASTKTVKFMVYEQQDAQIKELQQSWWGGTQTNYYKYWGNIFGDWRIYFRANKPHSEEGMDGKKDLAASKHVSRKFNVGDKVYSRIQAGDTEPTNTNHHHVIGYFSSPNFNATDMIQYGSSLSITDSTPDTIYVLITQNNEKINITTTNYIQSKASGGYLWQSTLGGALSSSASSIQVGTATTLTRRLESGYDFSFYVYNKNTGLGSLVNPGLYFNSEGKADYRLFFNAQGQLQLYFNHNYKYNTGVVSSFGSNTYTVDLRAYFIVNDDNTFIEHKTSGEYSGKVVFNIANSKDKGILLSDFAAEVNATNVTGDNKSMNNTTSGNYVGLLTGDIATYSGSPIGTSDSPFRGIFDGADHIIENVIISPQTETIEKIYASHYTQYTTYTAGDFGFFGTIAGTNDTKAVIKDLTLCDIQPGVELTYAVGVSYDLPKVAALCAVSSFAEISNINIKTFAPNIKFNDYATYVQGNQFMWKRLNDICVGGVVAYSSNTTITGVEVGKIDININGSVHTPGVGNTINPEGGEWYIGGAVGYAGNSTFNDIDIKEYNVAGANWTAQNYIFSAGGIVGHGNNKINLINCHVKGNQNYSNVHFRGHVSIGGLVGSASQIDIKNSSNVSDIIAQLKRFWIIENDTSKDTARIGGLVGRITSTSTIINSKSTGDISVSHVCNINDKRHMSVGGLVGVASKDAKLTNCYIYNSSIQVGPADIGNSNQQAGSTTSAGLFIGESSSTQTIQNCYFAYSSLVVNEGSDGIDTLNLVTNYGNNNYFLGTFDLGKKTGTINNISSLSGIRVLNNKGTVEIVFDNANVNSILSLTGIYGYNPNINEPTNGYTTSTFAAPFLLGTTDYKEYGDYVNVKVDCSKVTGLCQIADGYSSNAMYRYHNNSDNYTTFYVTDVKGLDNGNFSFKMPAIKNHAGQECVGYTTTHPNDWKNGFSIDVHPDKTLGDELVAAGKALNSKVTLYPVFAVSLQVLSPSPLYVKEGSGSSILHAENTRTYTTDNGQYQLRCEENPDSNENFYKYVYTLIRMDNSTEPISEADFWKIFTDKCNGASVAYKANRIFNSGEEGLNVNGTNFTYEANNTWAENGLSDLASAFDDYDNCEETIYAILYKAVNLHYGTIRPDSNTAYQYSDLYYLYFGDIEGIEDNKTTVTFSFANISTHNNNFVDLNNVYKATNTFAYDEYTIGNEVFLQGKVEGEQLSYLTLNTPSSLMESYYHIYKKVGVFAYYYETATSSTPKYIETLTDSSNYSPRTPYDAFYIQKGDDNFKTNYAFTGWNLTINNGKDVANKFVYANNNLELSGFSDALIELHFKPVFVQNNELGLPLSITEKPDIDTVITSSLYNFYIVDSPEDLIAVSYLVNYGGEAGANICIAENIYMADYTGFLPIGNAFSAYAGTLTGLLDENTTDDIDGKTHIIYDLQITSKVPYNSFGFNNNSKAYYATRTYFTEYIGLVGYANSNSRIHNLYLLDINYEATAGINIRMGGLVGYYAGTTISKVLVSGYIRATTGGQTCDVGGIVGYCKGDISYCVTKIQFSGTFRNIDGLATLIGMGNTPYISNCFDLCTAGSITGQTLFGLIRGKANALNCYSAYQNIGDNVNKNNTYSRLTPGSSNKYTFYDNINTACKDDWDMSSSVNGGLPYLSNVGVIKAEIVLDGRYLEDGQSQTFNKDFFILDETNYVSYVYALRAHGFKLQGLVTNYSDLDRPLSELKDELIRKEAANLNDSYVVYHPLSYTYYYYMTQIEPTFHFSLYYYRQDYDWDPSYWRWEDEEIYSETKLVVPGGTYSFNLFDIPYYELYPLSSSVYDFDRDEEGNIVWNAQAYTLDPFDPEELDTTSFKNFVIDHNGNVTLTIPKEKFSEDIYIYVRVTEKQYQLQFYKDISEVVDLNIATEENYIKEFTYGSGATTYYYASLENEDVCIYPDDVVTAPAGYTFKLDANGKILWHIYNKDTGECIPFEGITSADGVREINGESLNYEYYAKYLKRLTSGINAGKFALALVPMFETKSYKVEYVVDGKTQHTADVSYGDTYATLAGDDPRLSVEAGYFISGYEIDTTTYNTPIINEPYHLDNVAKLSPEGLTTAIAEQQIAYVYDGNIRLVAKLERMYNIPLNIYALDAEGEYVDPRNVFTVDYKIEDHDTGEITEIAKANYTNLSTFFAYGDRYVINSRYLDIIHISIILHNGSRIEKVVYNNNTKVDFDYYSSRSGYKLNNFEDDLEKLSNIEVGLDSTNNIMNVYTSSLVATENFVPNGEGYYEIGSAEDLWAYKLKLNGNDSLKAKIVNNIELFGYRFNLGTIGGILDGNNYCINGYTAYSPEEISAQSLNATGLNYGFIYSNNGTIKNLHFANTVVNLGTIYNAFGIIEHNYGTIQNVSLTNSYFTFSVGATDLYLGTLVGTNQINDGLENKIENINICNSNTSPLITIKEKANVITTGNIYFGGVAGLILGGTIDGVKTTFNLTRKFSSDCNYTLSVGSVAGIAPWLSASYNNEIYNVIVKIGEPLIGTISVDPSLLHVENILFNISYTGKMLSPDVNNGSGEYTNVVWESLLASKTIAKTYEDNNNNIETYFANSKFKVAYTSSGTADIVIPALGNFIKVNASGLENEKFYAKVNGKKVDYNYYTENRTINTVWAGSSYTEKNIDLACVIFGNVNDLEENGTNLFNINMWVNDDYLAELTPKYFNLNNEEVRVGQDYVYSVYRTYSPLGITFAKSNNFAPINATVNFVATPKETTVTYMFETIENADFDTNDIENIKNGIKIFVNDIEREINFEKNGTYLYNISFGNVCWLDEIKFVINLPSIAKLSDEYGIVVQTGGTINLIEDSKGKSVYTHNFVVLSDYYSSDNQASVTAVIDRSAFDVIYDLNANELFGNEKDNIKFNEAFVNGNDLVNLNTEGDLLTYIVEPVKESGVYIYYLPSIDDMISYEYNGIRYTLQGFNDNKDGNGTWYYDGEYNKLIETINSKITLYAIWEAVEYTIKADTLNGDSYFASLNGYTYSSDGFSASKTFKFGEQIVLPKLAKAGEYKASYMLNGLKMGDVFVGDNNCNTLDDFIYFDVKHIEKSVNKVVTIVADYSEIIYTFNFYSNDLDDGYDTYLVYDEENKPDYVTYKLTISQILSKDFELPVGFKAHHDFLFLGNEQIKEDCDIKLQYDLKNGKYFDFNTNLLVPNYKKAVGAEVDFVGGEYVYTIPQKWYAQYEIHKMNVSIYGIDHNMDVVLDFIISTSNSLGSILYSLESKSAYGKFDVNVITFIVPYNTTNISLPDLTYINEDYKFDGYVVKTGEGEYQEYTNEFVYQNHTEIFLNSKVKVNYIIKENAVIKNSYYLAYSLTNDENNEMIKYFYVDYNENVVLPSESDVERPNFTLLHFVIDESQKELEESITITKPTNVEFIYDGNTLSITLKTEHGFFPVAGEIGEDIFKGIESYQRINEKQAVVTVEFGKGITTEVLKTLLPQLSCEGYTFGGYEFETLSGLIDANDIANVVWTQNTYTITVIDNDAEIFSITKVLGEEITEIFTAPDKSNLGLTYLGLSLNKNTYTSFTMPNVMPNLETLYEVTKEGTNIELIVYTFYVSKVKVTINGYENSKVENTYNFESFVAGDYGEAVSFDLTAQNIINGFTLPVPSVKNNLRFASFVGYMFEDIMVTNERGVPNDNFVYEETVNLVQCFKYNERLFTILVNSQVESSDWLDFVKNNTEITKQIEFGSEIGNLPVLSLEGYVFKGYYFSPFANNLLVNNDFDVLIANEDGILLDEYKLFNEVYFNNLESEDFALVELKQIVAKFEYEFVEVTITSNDADLGEILQSNIISVENLELTYESIENGYKVKLPKASGLILTATPNIAKSNFKRFVLSDSRIYTDETIEISRILEDISILLEFEPKEYNVTYIINGKVVTSYINDSLEETMLQPSTFIYSSLEDVDLPNYQKTGYIFGGWYLEEGLITKADKISRGTTGDITLYGKLDAKIITVNVYSNIDNYSGLLKTFNITYNTLFEDLILDEISNYYLVGVFTEKDKIGIKINTDSLCVFSENLNLYAYYQEVPQQIVLEGIGSSKRPYLIQSTKDLEYVLYLLSTNTLNNSNVYFELAKNIELTTSFYVNSFNANLNGNGYVIYSNNKFESYNELTNLGTIERFVGLFGKNNGVISNLNLVVNETELLNLNENAYVYYGVISAINKGTISNCLVYYNIKFNATNYEFNGITNNDCELENCSEFESKVTINNITSEYNILQSGHSHNENIKEPQLADDVYLINTSEELAYVLSLDSSNYKISLQNNIDMKGKIIDCVDYLLTLNGNGYIISNLTVLNRTYLFNEISSLQNLALENVVFINLNEESSFINASNLIEKTYIKADIVNFNNIINTNNGSLTNSYFITNKQENLVNVNNANIENVYKFLGKIVETDNGTSLNAVVIDINDSNFETLLESFALAMPTNVWFTDEFDIMKNNGLPALINVGNTVFEFIYNSEILSVQTLPYSLINNKFITRDNTNINITIDLINTEYNISGTKVDNVLETLNVTSNIYQVLTKNYLGNYHTVEILTAINEYNVSYNAVEGGLIEIEGEQYSQYSKIVESGTQISVKAITNDGYIFAGWSDGVLDETRTDIIFGNTSITAQFEKLVKYNLIVDKNTLVDGFTVDGWTKVEDVETNVYSILISAKEDIDSYLSKLSLTKIDYVLSTFNKEQLSLYEFNLIPVFRENYHTINFNYNEELVNVKIIAEQSNSMLSGLAVVNEIDEKSFAVLNGYEVKIKVTPRNSYIAKLYYLNENVEVHLIDDYSMFVGNDSPFEMTYTFTDSKLIFVDMAIIDITTKFELDSFVSEIILENGTLENNEISTPKGTEIKFELVFNEGYTLDKFEIYNEDNELLDSNLIQLLNGKYCYFANEFVTIKAISKVQSFDVKLYSNIGGEISTNVIDVETLDLTDTDYDFGIKVSVEYGKPLKIYINPDLNYVISSISVNSNAVSISQYIEYKNLTENLEVIVEFSKVQTWLDLREGADGNADGYNDPMRFILSEFKGSGTKTNPYLISKEADLLTLAYNVNVKGISYKGVVFKSNEKDMILNFNGYYFTPIGTETVNFEGIILGDNLTIRNINIVGGSNIGLFRTLGSNAEIKAINLYGQISGNNLVGSIAGTNNGTIVGVSNNMTITTLNRKLDTNNIVGGLVALNNGTISRSYNTGKITSTATKVAGIAAVNNYRIENVYNEARVYANFKHENLIVAGLVAVNNSYVGFGYNNSNVSATETEATIIGTSLNAENVYYNANLITSTSVLGEAKTRDELINKENEIYANWNFETIWYFEEYKNALPKLNIVYEYRGSLTINVEFTEDFKETEKMILVDVTNLNSLYSIALSEQRNTVTINELSLGTYKLHIYSLLGTAINVEKTEIIFEEGINNITLLIRLSKTLTNGYHCGLIV